MWKSVVSGKGFDIFHMLLIDAEDGMFVYSVPRKQVRGFAGAVATADMATEVMSKFALDWVGASVH